MQNNGYDSSQTVIAVDAMGGDFAPREIVKGVAMVTRESPVHVILVGDEARIREELQDLEYAAEQIEIVHTDQVIGNEDHPREALEQKSEASMIVAAKLIAEGRAHGLVSAGNTGAYVLASSLFIPRIKGVQKTAIAAVYPTRNRQKRRDIFAMVLDVGANIHCSAANLVQFAIMGQVYAADIKGIEDPTVALLNIGKESYKGGETLSEVYRILAEAPNINFIGNIEGNDILKGLADVVVTEGYVGNIVMKTVEGLTDIMKEMGRYAFKHRFIWRLGMIALSGLIRDVKKLTDYSEYGGAPLLGYKEIVIKAHGRSRAKAIKNAVKLAAKSHRDRICERMEREITQVLPQSANPSQPRKL